MNRPRRPRRPARSAAVVALALAASACTLTPSLPPSSARGVGAGTTEVSAWAMPSLGATITRGVTDRLDLGAGAELQGTAFAWGKLVVLDRPAFALAVEARGFVGFDEDVAKASGLSLGPVAEIGSGRRTLVLGARYNELKHETYDDDRHLDDWFGIRPEPGQNYGTIGQVYAMLALGLSGSGHLHLGAACDYYLALDDVPDRFGDRPDERGCYPMFGLSFPVN